MSIPPPGLGGGAARTGPPPGFGNSHPSGGPTAPTGGGGRNSDGQGGTATIVRAQIVFLLTTLTEDVFEKASNEIRTLASTNGPEMYHHFLRRTAIVANPVLQTLIQHSQQYKDDPAAPPPNVPTNGQAALAWRLLVVEATRAARDVTLAPHFVLVMLSQSQSTPLPLPSLGMFNLPPPFLFALAAFTLASPNVFPQSHPYYEHVQSILRQTYHTAIELLRAPGIPFWSSNTSNDEITLQEARTLILALYPRLPSSGPGSTSRPATPTNPTFPHASPLSSPQRALLLNALTVKFSSPAIVLQTLSALSPGGPPRSPGSIPLEDMLFELGDNLTQDDGTVEAVVQRWWGTYLLESGDEDEITEEASRTIMGICEGLRDGRLVDVHGVVKGLSLVEGVSFPKVIKAFDQQTSLAAYPTSTPLLINLLLAPSQSPVPPIAGLLPASLDAPLWDNIGSQLAVLSRLTTLPPDALPIFTLPSAPSPSSFARIIDPPPNDNVWSKSARQQARDIQGAGLWNTIGLMKVLVTACGLADSDRVTEDIADTGRMASELLERAGALAPELTLIALEKLPKPLPGPVAILHSRELALYLSTPPSSITSSQLVFHQMWQQNPDRLLQVLLDFYAEDENHLGRVLEIGMEIKILDKLLGAENVHFALDIAALAAGKEYIDLEKWLADGVAVKGDDFLQAVLDFLEHKIRLEIDHRHQPESGPPILFTLGTDVYSIFIRVIRNAEQLSPEDVARFKHMRSDILILHPRLLDLRPGSKQEQGFAVAKFSKDVVAQVDDMYQRMYGGEMKLDDVIDELKRCQKSDDDRDREVFACALHSLFDEYKFVKAYPAKELTMTGILFGGIIDSRLVKDIPAFVATRYVLDACKTSPNEALYSFGINALSVLRGSLVDFPGLCRSLLEVPALHESHPVLINDIIAALSEREELDQQGGIKLAFPALKLPVLVEEGVDEFKEPDPKTRDAIMFNINQIAPSNFEAKCQDLLKLFDDDLSRWFAHYFIDVRVSLEANRHEIYLQLLESIGSPVLERHVLWETYRKARDLINSEATISSAAERTTLKTIAMWLGRFTLARNKPIKMRELSVKDLLIQGFDNKRLIVAIPFVCNLLVFCKDSVVFHPPNPWMVAILSLLVEFYHFAELRLNLKFEIEVLFSKLDIQLDSIQASSLLRTHVPPPPPQSEMPNRLDAELQRATSEIMNGAQRFETPVNDAFARLQQLQTEQAAQAAQDAFLRRVDELIARLPEHLHFSHEYPIFTAPTLKRVVHHSIDRAIREIINPVVERSVTIAGISSRDLVQKDFGMEGDPMKLRHAAHLMVQNLAGNLALVTCKEPLRTSMISNVRTMLGHNGFTDDNMPDAMIAGVVNDNIDAACSVIKTAAMEKAAKDIDVNLAPQYAARRAHRESRSQQPFWDGASFGVAISHTALPDALRLKNGGLSPAQLRVYDDFGEPTRVAVSTSNGDGYAYDNQEKPAYPSEIDADVMASPQPVSATTSLQRFHELANEVDQVLQTRPADTITALPSDHALRGLIHAAMMIVTQSSNRDQTSLVISQKVVQLLYKVNSQLGREVYVLMLQQLCELSATVNHEVRDWLIYADDMRKLNVPVSITLIRAGLIGVAELDAQLAQMVLRGTTEILNFAAELIREGSLTDHAIIPRNAFAATLAAMLKMQEAGNATQSVNQLFDDLRGFSRRDSISENGDKPAIDNKLQERLAHYFLEWVRVFSANKAPEAAFVPYITYLQKEGILNGEDVSSAFYRTAITCSVDLDSSRLGSGGSFYGTDALAKLIVLIVKNYGDKTGTSSVSRTVYYFNKIITILSYSLVQRQLEMGDSFDQRPWTRLYTSMLSELQSIEHSLPETYIGCLKTIANDLGLTQPTYAPRFAFGWLSIVSHRFFMPKLLRAAQPDTWTDFHRCLMWLLRFLAPVLKSSDMGTSSRSLFRATVRLLLLLLHDFPDFLAEYYHTLSTAIPPNCVQLRNIVLAGFPVEEGPLPDHYIRLEQLIPAMQRFPNVRSDYASALQSGNVRGAIDQYVRTGSPASQAIVSELKNRIAVKTMTSDGAVITWNHTLLHATVFYLGTSCVARTYSATYSTGGQVEYNPQAKEVSLLMELAAAFDGEGQYYMLSVVADQLRYPSAHTLFFISFMLHLFSSSSGSDAAIKAKHSEENGDAAPSASGLPERIARVLLERVLAIKPHPWGLIVTFIELLENESYGFWKQPFIRTEEEIYMMFARAQQGIMSGGDVSVRS